jgi:anaerobic carbon-monoxide dehydrogenase iron sulfur subunit
LIIDHWQLKIGGSMKRLYVRPELCTGCKTCELACAVEHSRSKNLLGAMMESLPPHPRLYVEAVMTSAFEVLKMPMTCRHCDPAPCISACIPQAMHRSPDDVVTNVGGKHACIACGMCIMTCPFGMIARAPNTDGKVMALKCDLCPDRAVPACAASCPEGAIVFLEGDEFAHESRQRASAVLATARQVRAATLVKAQEE